MNEKLKENNYIFIPKFISSIRAKMLASGFKHFCVENNLTGDSQALNSFSSYDFLPFVRLLVEKIPQVSEICGEQLLPTYAYARIYKEKSVLVRHSDRAACEVSLTLNLNQDLGWPIFIVDSKGKEKKIDMEPGDAMMYLGCEADHWREEFLGKEHTQVFLHYVMSFGERSWAYFDAKKDDTTNMYFDEIPVTLI